MLDPFQNAKNRYPPLCSALEKEVESGGLSVVFQQVRRKVGN